jgi:hypothetical protein
MVSLSSLIASHQIFNVQYKIQEDHLQQLARFAEYAARRESHRTLVGNKCYALLGQKLCCI